MRHLYGKSILPFFVSKMQKKICWYYLYCYKNDLLILSTPAVHKHVLFFRNRHFFFRMLRINKLKQDTGKIYLVLYYFNKYIFEIKKNSNLFNSMH